LGCDCCGVYVEGNVCANRLAPEIRCADKDDVREFLDDLRVKWEELASVGVDIDEKVYRSTILASVPFSLSNFASAQLAAVHKYPALRVAGPTSWRANPQRIDGWMMMWRPHP